MNCKLGELIGYSVRFDDNTSNKTKIKFITDGMLMREAMLSPDLLEYNIIIIDEAHERTLQTDILLGILKNLLYKRMELKVIVMSATLQVDLFSNFFNDFHPSILNIQGRTFPVDIFYTYQPEPDYLEATLSTIYQIHMDSPPGDILVFLTGQEEIQSLYNILDKRKNMKSKCGLEMMPLMIFAALPQEQQLLIFNPPPDGKRKIILSTNISESSITINGIRYVIDPGFVKIRGFHSLTGVDCLLVLPISKAQAWQRAGRAGREAPGQCYRIYTEESFLELRNSPLPEIKRCNMCTVILQLKTMNISNIFTFPFIEPPTKDTLTKSFEILYLLQALDSNGDITELGKKIAYFPLDPIYSNMLIKAVDFHCLEEILDLVSLLSVESIFYTPKGKEQQVMSSRKQFTAAEGDHITLLNVYKNYKSVKGDKEWCKQHFINIRSLYTADKIRSQLVDYCKHMKYDFQSCNGNIETILKCLTASSYLKIAQKIDQVGISTRCQYRTLHRHQIASIHPTSSLFGINPQPDYIIFNISFLKSIK